MVRPEIPVDSIDVAAYKVPTDAAEGDGTLRWTATGVVLVEARAADTVGLGWSYCPPAGAGVVTDTLADVVRGRDAMNVGGCWEAMVATTRNAIRPGLVTMAISAVDIALWDLKARLLDLPLVRLLGAVHDEVPVYGSGGFTTYDHADMRAQLLRWVEGMGLSRVKIKIGEDGGTRVGRDLARLGHAREIVGDDVELYADANGAYSRKQAIRVAEAALDMNLTWFEEPVSSDHLAGLAEVRHAVLPDVTAGEYGFDLFYFESMCAAEAVDCLQIDVTRCGGITEWRRIAAVAKAHGLDVSGHCAPALHAHVLAATPNQRHLEWFHDHERIESMLFDGLPRPTGGALRPTDTDMCGLGMGVRRADAEPYRVA